MTADDEKDKHPFTDIFASDRNNGVQIFIALVIGVFSVLIIFLEEDVKPFSTLWFVLTATYWGLVAVGIVAYLNWLVFILITDNLSRRYNEENDKKIEKAIDNTFLKKWHDRMIRDPNHKRLRWQLWAWLILMIVISGALWLTVSFVDIFNTPLI